MLIVKILAVVAAYLAGSINSAILVGKLFGYDDIRKHGSGNAGSTNVLRTAGKKAAALTFAGDVLKGIIVVLLAKAFSGYIGEWVMYGACLAVVIGHNYPVFFGFKGGKGIATSAAVMIVLDPILGLAVTVISILIMAISKYVSLGSLTGAVLYPVLAAIFRPGNVAYVVYAVLLGALAIWRHRANIKRLINGTENKLSKKG